MDRPQQETPQPESNTNHLKLKSRPQYLTLEYNRPRNSGDFSGKNARFPAEETDFFMAKATQEPAESTERDQPLPKSNTRKPGRPGKNSPTEDSHSFFETVGKVHRDDWGTRYFLYVYRLEPVIDRTRGGEPKYIMQYTEAVNEDRLLADHGSGRYKLILNFRKPGVDRGDEIDTGYVALLNMNYPPKIAPGEWVDDPRNKQWAWAKAAFPKDPGAAAAGIANDPLKALEAVSRIRKDLADEMKPNAGDTPEQRMLLLATIVEKLAPRASSPDETMKNIASIMTALRPPEDKLSAFLLEQHSDLMKEFLKAKQESDRPNNGLGVVKEIVTGLRDLMPQVRELIPGAEGHGTRSRLNGWQEFAVAMGPTVASVLGPISAVVAQMFAARMQNPPPGAPPPQLALPHAPLGNGAPGPGLMPFLNIIANPLINYAREMAEPDHRDPQEVGEDFAAWVYEGFGSNALYNDAIGAARMMGPVGLIAAFRATPYWTDRGPLGAAPSLAMLESQLFPFLSAFLAWTPRHDDEDIEDGDDDEQPLKIHTASESPAA